MPATPPLWVGLLAALLAAATIGWSAAPRYLARLEPSAGDPLALYARQFLASTHTAGEARIMALGSSLLWAATPAADSTAAAAQQQLRWMRLSRGGAGLGYLGSALAEIERDPPQILLIEGNLLMPLQGSQFNDELRNDTMLTLKKIAASLLPWQQTATLASTLELPYDQSHDLSCDAHSIGSGAQAQAQHADVLLRLYQAARPDTALAARLSTLARRGVLVVVLDLPRSSPLEQAVANEKRQWLARLHAVLPAGPALRYATAPSLPAGALYCDGSHLSPAGSRLFGAWWWPQLRRMRDLGV